MHYSICKSRAKRSEGLPAGSQACVTRHAGSGAGTKCPLAGNFCPRPVAWVGRRYVAAGGTWRPAERGSRRNVAVGGMWQSVACIGRASMHASELDYPAQMPENYR